MLADSHFYGTWVRQIENPTWLVSTADRDPAVCRGERCERGRVGRFAGICVDAHDPSGGVPVEIRLSFDSDANSPSVAAACKAYGSTSFESDARQSRQLAGRASVECPEYGCRRFERSLGCREVPLPAEPGC